MASVTVSDAARRTACASPDGRVRRQRGGAAGQGGPEVPVPRDVVQAVELLPLAQGHPGDGAQQLVDLV